MLALLLLMTAVQDPTALTVLARGGTHRVEVTRDDQERTWVAADALPALTGFEVRPEGLCHGDACVPVTAQGWRRESEDGLRIDLGAVLERLEVAVARSSAGDVWSCAPAPLLRRAGLESGRAPALELRDRRGETVRLADLRGKKVVLVTWASW